MCVGFEWLCNDKLPVGQFFNVFTVGVKCAQIRWERRQTTHTLRSCIPCVQPQCGML